MPPRIIHVDLDAFFVEVCRQQNPELRDIDLLVVGGRRESRGVVQSASYGARKFGVHSGMPVQQAVRLCPEATFFQGEFRHYREASRAVREVLKQFSPVIVMASLDEAYLDFGGTERLYPVSLMPVAEAIRDAVATATGLDCSVGIGPNRMVAKIASDSAKPRGMMEVRSGWEEGFMAGLALRSLPGIGPRTADRLSGYGLTTVWQVQQKSVAELENLVGSHGSVLKRRAHGHGGTTLRGGQPAKSISRETTLSRDSTDSRRLLRLLTLFSARVGAQLRDDGLVARTVTLKLRHSDFRTITRSSTLDNPTDLDAEILEAARALFMPCLREVMERGQGIRLVGVSLSALQPGDPPDLFEPAERVRRRELTRAMDLVRQKYGFDAVKVAELVTSNPEVRNAAPPPRRNQ